MSFRWNVKFDRRYMFYENHGKIWKMYTVMYYTLYILGSYFKTSSSLAVRWGLLSPVLPPGVDSPEELKERLLTPLVTDVDPDVEVPGLFKIPFIASALRRNNICKLQSFPHWAFRTVFLYLHVQVASSIYNW